MKTDFSLHFTIKGQELSEVEKKFHDWSNKNTLLNEENAGTRVHTCFLPRHVVEAKGFDTSLVEFIESLTDGDEINWFYASTTLDMSRVQMLETIKRLGGKAIFVGEIKEGVEVEYKLAEAAGIEIIHIP